MQPTPPPATTAESQDWYSSGGPISYGGNVYYPAGPITHFLPNEMVETGTFEDVPIYARTTREPGSVIYVPLAGGLVRPYERRRDGDLAGTVGSTAPSFPVVLPTAPTIEPAASLGFVQAPSDPIGGGARGIPDLATGDAAARVAQPVGTSGPPLPTPAVRRAPGHVESVQRPVGLNGVFLEYENARWFAAGPAVEFTPGRFKRVGEYRGFPVFMEEGRPDVIYVSLVSGPPGLLSPYKAR